MPTIAFLCAVLCQAPCIGERPYELDWAGRTEDRYPALADFEDPEDWRVEAVDSVASFTPSRERQIWGTGVGKLVYRATGPRPSIRIRPPRALEPRGPFDAVTLWVWGNNWGWAPDPSTPQVSLACEFQDAEGREFSVPLGSVDWTEWHLLHRRLTPPLIETAAKGARFTAIAIDGGTNREDRVLYFDNLAVFLEEFPPLEFEARPRRGIEMFPGQDVGTHRGPGRLPFPTREETILPEDLEPDAKSEVAARGDGFVFTTHGRDGTLRFEILPRTGTLSDVSASWEGRVARFRPCVDGGVRIALGEKALAPEKATHEGTELDGGTVRSRWTLETQGRQVKVEYRYRSSGKTLMIDVLAPGGDVAEVRWGRAEGVENPRLVTHPFYVYSWGPDRPATIVAGDPQGPVFITANTDWYRSNASTLWAENGIFSEGVIQNGGTRYLPRTDGRRNGAFERFFLSVSTRIEETLPVIPNPPSPWKHITGKKVWRAHGAGDRKADREFWAEIHRWGMREIVVTDHETGWRDGGESFTFRTRAAPGKGGDAGQYEYARWMQDHLGFTYGPYNNFTDFSPVNEYWDFDRVARSSDLQLQRAWMRCYAPKPARAVEFAAKLPPLIEEKFHFSTAYCDVHTAVAPWDRTDYDARVPGAGTFGEVFYAFGEIMLLEKAAWSGPVYSEGTYHYLYSGLTDGNYGQDNRGKLYQNPWLVDFDLRRMHDLSSNFGMGSLGMFYGDGFTLGSTREESDRVIDRFLAATVAFGHTGFLVVEGGLHNTLRSYYMLQALHARYALARAESIRYADRSGKLLDSSLAISTGAYRRSQVLTRYADGTITAVNGHPEERLRAEAFGRVLDLPPNGWVAWTEDGSIDVASTDRNVRRLDHAYTPEYVYLGGRGRFTRFARGATDGIAILRILPGGRHEVLAHEAREYAFLIEASLARAVDTRGRDLGPARLRRARGLTYILPPAGTASVILEGEGPASNPALACSRDEVVPGERVLIRGRETHEFTVPCDARPGERIWLEREGSSIDFTVVPLLDLDCALEGEALLLDLLSHASEPAPFVVRALGRETRTTLDPGRPGRVRLELGEPEGESERVLRIEVSCGGVESILERGLRTVLKPRELIRLPPNPIASLVERGGTRTRDFHATGALAEPRRTSSGGVARDGYFTHPPYLRAPGAVFLAFPPIALPKDPPAALRALVGKGDGSVLGDGIVFRLLVRDRAGRESIAGEARVQRHEWFPFEADLAPWAGEEVTLELVADVGPSDDSNGDWGAWAEPRIETLAPLPTREIVLDARPWKRAPSPSPCPGVSTEDLRRAAKGRLVYSAKGLEGPRGPYATAVELNGVPLGGLETGPADETKGIFAEELSVPLSTEAIRRLERANTIVIHNPGGDCFSVRDFRIALELADGRVCSSEVSLGPWSQPESWPHAEGIAVSARDEISVRIWFPR